MIGRIARPVLAAGLTAGVVVALAPWAVAHEGRPVGDGDLHMVVGFGTEPAYAGQPNSVQLILEHHGDAVVDLGNTLDVEVAFGDQTMALELEPFFAVGEFGTPGDYRAWFIPTRSGRYEFHFSGTIEGEEIDETFTSGESFSDVLDPADIEFPVQDPTTGELAERIDREIPRLTSAIEEASTTASAEARAAALAEVSEVSDEAESARTMGVIGIGVGALGLIAGLGALARSRRKAA